MSTHPINLIFRFLLEITALGTMGYWGWMAGEGYLRLIMAFLIPFIAAMVWGIFAVPNDPSRSGRAPVPVSGTIRLVIELTIFAISIWMVYNLGYSLWGRLFAVAVITHYLLSMDRLTWLLKKSNRNNGDNNLKLF